MFFKVCEEASGSTLTRRSSWAVPLSSSGAMLWLTMEQKLWHSSRISFRQWKTWVEKNSSSPERQTPALAVRRNRWGGSLLASGGWKTGPAGCSGSGRGPVWCSQNLWWSWSAEAAERTETPTRQPAHKQQQWLLKTVVCLMNSNSEEISKSYPDFKGCWWDKGFNVESSNGFWLVVIIVLHSCCCTGSMF